MTENQSSKTNANRIPYCINKIIEGEVEAQIDDRATLIQVLYRWLKASKVKQSEQNALINALNNKFKVPLTSEEILKILNEVLKTGTVVMPTCEEIKNIPTIAEICNKYGSKCPVNRKSVTTQLKSKIEDIVANIVPNTMSVIMKPGQPTYYEIHFMDGHAYEASDEVIVDGAKDFIKWYMNTYRVLISIKKEDWMTIVQAWLDMAVVKEYEPLTFEETVAEFIMNRLRNSVFVTDIKEAINRANTVYVDPNDKTKIYVYNQHLLKMIEREGLTSRVSIQKLREILDPYKAEATKVIRAGDNVYRFWVLDANKCGITVQTTVQFEDAKKEALPDTITKAEADTEPEAEGTTEPSDKNTTGEREPEKEYKSDDELIEDIWEDALRQFGYEPPEDKDTEEEPEEEPEEEDEGDSK